MYKCTFISSGSYCVCINFMCVFSYVCIFIHQFMEQYNMEIGEVWRTCKMRSLVLVGGSYSVPFCEGTLIRSCREPVKVPQDILVGFLPFLLN